MVYGYKFIYHLILCLPLSVSLSFFSVCTHMHIFSIYVCICTHIKMCAYIHTCLYMCPYMFSIVGNGRILKCLQVFPAILLISAYIPAWCVLFRLSDSYVTSLNRRYSCREYVEEGHLFVLATKN